MTCLIKCPPLELSDDGTLNVTVRRFRRPDVQVGDAAYVWFSETQGGSGLAFRGLVEAVTPGPWYDVTVGAVVPAIRELGKADLERSLACEAGAAIQELAGKLYRHSHNKIVMVDEAERILLDSFFAP